MALNIDSPLPLYFQLKQLLVAEIEQSRWKPGDMLPTEIQLQSQYDVSRTTVRQAMRELELEGRITRYRGRGTFVAKPKVTHSPGTVPMISDRLSLGKSKAGWQVLSFGWTLAPREVASHLALTGDESVFCLRRLRLEDEDPIGYHVAYVSPAFASFIDQAAFLQGGSLRYLRKHEALSSSTADRVLEAVPAGQEEAELLGIQRGAPMLLIRRLVRSSEGQPVEYFRGIYRGDRFEYHISNMQAITASNE